jgi:ABC-type polysaccharide/polyol phosphate transport system ATPase subunit
MVCGGVLVPDRGKVTVHGRVQLLALGVGFKNELSGRENVFISGSLVGLSKKDIKSHMTDIEAFAELGEFMDEPVRTYSAGMRSRLGFAIATAVKPDILILDEIMATGDKAFQDKAMQRMREMRGLARSVIVVSHNPGQLRKLATRVLWLEKGRTIMLGDPKEVLNAYDNFCKNPEKWLNGHPEIDTGGIPREGGRD